MLTAALTVVGGADLASWPTPTRGQFVRALAHRGDDPVGRLALVVETSRHDPGRSDGGVRSPVLPGHPVRSPTVASAACSGSRSIRTSRPTGACTSTTPATAVDLVVARFTANVARPRSRRPAPRLAPTAGHRAQPQSNEQRRFAWPSARTATCTSASVTAVGGGDPHKRGQSKSKTASARSCAINVDGSGAGRSTATACRPAKTITGRSSPWTRAVGRTGCATDGDLVQRPRRPRADLGDDDEDRRM